MISDEIWNLPIDRQARPLFFQLISRRYERGPMTLTSNHSFGSGRRLPRPGDRQRDPRPDPASQDDDQHPGRFVSAEGQVEVGGGQADHSGNVSDGEPVGRWRRGGRADAPTAPRQNRRLTLSTHGGALHYSVPFTLIGQQGHAPCSADASATYNRLELAKLGPDFSTDEETRLDAELVSNLVTQLVYKPLQAHADSAANIPNLSYADDGQYFTVRFMDGGQDSQDLDYVYVIDKRNLTYSAVQLTGQSQEIDQLTAIYRRYQDHPDSPTFGQPTPTDAALQLRMGSLVSQIASNRAARDAERLLLWADDVQAQQQSCLGIGEIEMNHVDVVQIILFSTYAMNDWANQSGVPPVSIPPGICWADPDTAAGTSWYTSSCTMYHSVAPMSSAVRVVHPRVRCLLATCKPPACR